MKQAIMVTVRLYEVRDTAKNLLQSDYENKTKTFKEFILKISHREGVGILEVLIELLKTEEVKENKYHTMMFISAAVDLMEEE